MPRKIALKRLTASDLTFFHWYFENQAGGSNQKSINLNASVFVDQLYPAPPLSDQGRAGWVPVDVLMYGPGSAGLLQIQRKIRKGSTYKNWRLNGEFVREESQRFRPLASDDFVLLEFIGHIVPTQIRALFVAAGLSEDAALFAQFAAVLPAAPRAMRTLTAEELAGCIDRAAGLVVGHPAFEFTLDEALEDAALGGQEGITRIRRRQARRSVTQEDLRRARIIAEVNGETGEQFVNQFLRNLVATEQLSGFTWESADDAVAPFDFTVVEASENVRVDVKATDGGFERRIHISLAELLAMAEPTARYDLYRVFDMADEQACMRVAKNLRPFAENILARFQGLAHGVLVDGVSVDPRTLSFSQTVIPLTLSVEEE